MVIIPVGSLILQVEREQSERRFKERLLAEITEQVLRVIARCIEAMLEFEVTELIGREWYERRRDQKRGWIEAYCGKCGSHDRRRFSRNGHYPRKLSTHWGRVEIKVPQIECQCGGMVRMPFQTLRRGQRIWDDLEGEIREEYGWGKSLRWLKTCVDAKLGGSVGLCTLNRRMHELARLVPHWQGEKLLHVPPGGPRGWAVGHIDVWYRREENGQVRSSTSGEESQEGAASGCAGSVARDGASRSRRLGDWRGRERRELGSTTHTDV